MSKRALVRWSLTIFLACAAACGAGKASAIQPGNYSGLFYEPDGYWQNSSGTLSLKVTTTGKYSGKLQVGTTRYSFSGTVTPDNTISEGIPRKSRNPLLIELSEDPQDADVLWGSVQDGVWTSDLYADRAVFNGKTSVSPDRGQYTMLVPGDFTSLTEPGGDGYGTLTVDAKGAVKMSGVLADGTKVTQSATISKGGLWPLFAALYSGGGSLYSWVALNPTQDEELQGDVTWIKPNSPGARYYPGGFALAVSVWGSRYTPPAKGQPVLGYAEGAVEFNGGNLVESFTNHVMLDSNNKVYNVSQNKLTMKITTSNGMISGKVADAITGDMLPFKGVVLQSYGVAAGYFDDVSRTGEIWLEQW